MEELYIIGGATPDEAACLAPITGEGEPAVNQATEAPTDAETQAAIECVGSQQRLMEIAQGVADYFESTADFSHLEGCEDYFREGVILRAPEAFDLAGCVTADGEPAFYFPIESEECVDGQTLYWVDDAGWGYDGEPWHADAFEPPAQELSSCRG